MIVYVLFVHKKSVSKRKVCIIFTKNKKFKKTPKKPKKPILVGFLGGFFGFFFVGFFIANPVLRTRATCLPPPAPASATPASITPFRSPCCRPGSFRFLFSLQNFS
jgi:hypothetical protein